MTTNFKSIVALKVIPASCVTQLSEVKTMIIEATETLEVSIFITFELL